MDQTTLATSLYIIGRALGSTDQVSWIASGYFMHVPLQRPEEGHSLMRRIERLPWDNCYMADSPTFGPAK